MRRIAVIALDGGEFSLIDEMIKEGRMPTLENIIREGTRGGMLSVIPPITPSAWSTFLTGKNPGKHGILEFIVKDREGESPANARLRRGKTVFRLASDAGMKVVSLSIPLTYPPEQVNGLMISDFMTPRGAKDYGLPIELLQKIERRFGPYRLHINEVYTPRRVEKFFADIEEEVSYKTDVAAWIAEGSLKELEDWNLFAFHIHGVDRLQHELWHLIDPAHPLYDFNESNKYKNRFLDFFSKLDTGINKFVQKLNPTTDMLFIISDHGFGPVYKFINMNVWLMEKGYLKLRSRAVSRIKKLLFQWGATPKNAYRFLMLIGQAKIRETVGMTKRVGFFNILNKVMLSFQDVDWTRTTAYSKGYYGQIFLNLKGREPFGIVPQEEYEALRRRIGEEIIAIKDKETGAQIIKSIFYPENIYSGPYLRNAPDIIFLPADMKYKAIGMTDFPSNNFLEPVYANSGDHRLEGIFIAKGEKIKKGYKLAGNAWLGDSAPTILYTLGLPIPTDMDGKVLVDIFYPDYLKNNPTRYVGSSEEDSFNSSGYTVKEKEQVIQKLKDMGYL